MPRELTSTERDLLTSRTQDHALDLRGRTISDLTIPASAFVRAQLQDVVFEDVAFQGTAFRGASLGAVSMTRCMLKKVVLQDCQISHLTLVECQGEDISIERSQLHQLRTSQCQLRHLGLVGSTVEGWSDERSQFGQATLCDATVSSPHWTRTQWEGGQAKTLMLRGGKLSDVSWRQVELHEVALQGCEIDGLTLGPGAVTGLVFAELKGRSLTLAELDGRHVRLARCELLGAGLTGGRVEGLVMEDSSVTLLAVFGAELADLRVSGVRLIGPILDRTVLSGLLDRVDVLGPDLTGSRIEQLTVRDSSLSGLVVVRGASFRGLQLRGLRLGSNYALDDEGASYGDGDRLPAKAP